MKNTIKLLSSIFLCLLFIILPSVNLGIAMAKNEVIESDKIQMVTSKSAILVDKVSGTVIFAKDQDRKLPIASMTKLVTLGVVFETIDQGKLKLEDNITISKEAAETTGSEAFLDEGCNYSVEELIKTVIISSANDSAVALAETVAGSESNFVKKMNTFAEKHSMCNSVFSNSTGLPSANHYSTAEDMVKVYNIVGENEIYKKYANIWIDELEHPSGRKTQLVNTNRLVKFYKGSTGGKTGFTNEAGFCLTASAKRGDMTLIAVVMGENTSAERFKSVTNLFNYGFENYENRVVVKKDNPLCDIILNNTSQKVFKCYAKHDYIKFLKKGDDFIYNTHIELYPVKAPKNAHDPVGKLYILDQYNIVIDEIDIVIGVNVESVKLYEILDQIYKAW